MPSTRIGAFASLISMPWRSSQSTDIDVDKGHGNDQTKPRIDITGQPTFARNIVNGPRGIPSRSEQVARLANSSSIANPYDILVIGGGGTYNYS